MVFVPMSQASLLICCALTKEISPYKTCVLSLINSQNGKLTISESSDPEDDHVVVEWAAHNTFMTCVPGQNSSHQLFTGHQNILGFLSRNSQDRFACYLWCVQEGSIPAEYPSQPGNPPCIHRFRTAISGTH